VFLNTLHYVTTVAKSACELWFVPTEDIEELLVPWPDIRSKLTLEGRQFLSKVLDFYEDSGADQCPTCLADMMPFASEEDMQTTSVDDDKRAYDTGTEVLIAAMLLPASEAAEAVEALAEEDKDETEEELLALDFTPATLFSKHGIYHPDSFGKMVWDILLSLVILYSVLTITYQIGFDYTFEGALANLDICIDILFAFDIVASFNTAVVDSDGNMTVNRSSIALIYLKGWFAIDFVSTVPIDRIVLAVTPRGSSNAAVLRSIKLIRAIRLVRLAKIMRIVQKSGFFDKVEDGLGLHPAVLRFFKISVIMSFFAHLFACVIFATANCDGKNPGQCWVDNYCIGAGAWFDDDSAGGGDGGGRCLSDSDRSMKYLVSLYYSFTTMTTIGYGDISPFAGSRVELITMILVQIVGTTIFAYVVGNLVSIIVNMNPGLKMRKESLHKLNLLMEEMRSSFSFRRAVRIHFMFRQKVTSVFSEADLLMKMSPDLRILTTMSIHGKHIIPKVPALHTLEADMRGAFTLLLPRLKPYNFSAGSAIFHPMLGTHREMFFLTSGTVTAVQRSGTSGAPGCGGSGGGGGGERRSARQSLDRTPLDSGGAAGTSAGERYEAGEFFGEVAMLIPSDVQFRLRVEARVATAFAQSFGLHRNDYVALQANYPALASILGTICREKFEHHFNGWVTITTPGADLDVIAGRIGLRMKGAAAAAAARRGATNQPAATGSFAAAPAAAAAGPAAAGQQGREEHSSREGRRSREGLAPVGAGPATGSGTGSGTGHGTGSGTGSAGSAQTTPRSGKATASPAPKRPSRSAVSSKSPTPARSRVRSVPRVEMT